MSDDIAAVSMSDGNTATAVGPRATILRTNTGEGVTSVHTSPAPSLLEQSYPNPANESTVIAFRLYDAGHVVIDIFDEAGASVAVLVDRQMTPGSHTTTVDTRSLPAGRYYYRIRTGEVVQTRTMVVAR